MNTETNKKLEQEIKRRNRLFSKATPEQKRVLIARDVLNLLKKRKITPLRQRFVFSYSLAEKLANTFHEDQPSISLQREFLTIQESCRACALGSMMISCTLYNNKETLADYDFHFQELGESVFYNNTSKPTNQFAEIFSKEQLALIEVCFEATGTYNSIGFVRAHCTGINLGITDEVVQKAEKFGAKYPEPEPRLKAIMRNIIKNKGTFVV